jgi:hypothetical protein
MKCALRCASLSVAMEASWWYRNDGVPVDAEATVGVAVEGTKRLATDFHGSTRIEPR